jgi:octaprenyl-diphosphate synthase
MQATREAASSEAQLAMNSLRVLPDSLYKEALSDVASQLLDRQT